MPFLPSCFDNEGYWKHLRSFYEIIIFNVHFVISLSVSSIICSITYPAFAKPHDIARIDRFHSLFLTSFFLKHRQKVGIFLPRQTLHKKEARFLLKSHFLLYPNNKSIPSSVHSNKPISKGGGLASLIHFSDILLNMYEQSIDP